jgi:DNA replication and repair protein RecF
MDCFNEKQEPIAPCESNPGAYPQPVDNFGESRPQIRDSAGTLPGELSDGGQTAPVEEQVSEVFHRVSPDFGERVEPEKTELSPINLSLITNINSVNNHLSLSWIHRIELRQFRNYAEETVELGPGFNLVAGPNAQGKTNLLEALYLLSTTRLLRGRRDHEAILDTAEAMSVEGTLTQSDALLKISLARGGRKRAFLNGMSLPRAADLLGRLPSVTISTADLELVRGDPSDRRLYLDLELSSLYPVYLRAFTVYRRALEQRNALLRHARETVVSPIQFEPWELELARSGVEIREIRRRHLVSLEAAARQAHARIGDGETLALDIEEGDPARSEDAYLSALAESRSTDVQRGGTSVGPHRDDLAIFVDGRDARHFASQGQQRTAVIAIKLAGLPLGTDIFGKPPLLLLDDMLSDLDADRRRRLTEAVIDQAGQALLTCTEAEAAGPGILASARAFRVEGGRVYAA